MTSDLNAHVYVCVCVCVCVYIYIKDVYVDVCVYIYICVCVCVSLYDSSVNTGKLGFYLCAIERRLIFLCDIKRTQTAWLAKIQKCWFMYISPNQI